MLYVGINNLKVVQIVDSGVFHTEARLGKWSILPIDYHITVEAIRDCSGKDSTFPESPSAPFEASCSENEKVGKVQLHFLSYITAD